MNKLHSTNQAYRKALANFRQSKQGQSLIIRKLTRKMKYETFINAFHETINAKPINSFEDTFLRKTEIEFNTPQDLTYFLLKWSN